MKDESLAKKIAALIPFKEERERALENIRGIEGDLKDGERMKKILEKLIEGDWTEVCNYGDCKIYRKENKRILYQPETDKIVIFYNFEEQDYKA